VVVCRQAETANADPRPVRTFLSRDFRGVDLSPSLPRRSSRSAKPRRTLVPPHKKAPPTNRSGQFGKPAFGRAIANGGEVQISGCVGWLRHPKPSAPPSKCHGGPWPAEVGASAHGAVFCARPSAVASRDFLDHPHIQGVTDRGNNRHQGSKTRPVARTRPAMNGSSMTPARPARTCSRRCERCGCSAAPRSGPARSSCAGDRCECRSSGRTAPIRDCAFA